MKHCSSSYVSANRPRKGVLSYENELRLSIPWPMLVDGKDDVLAIADCAKISSICGVAQLSTICMSCLAHSRFLLSIRTSLEFLDRRSRRPHTRRSISLGSA